MFFNVDMSYCESWAQQKKHLITFSQIFEATKHTLKNIINNIEKDKQIPFNVCDILVKTWKIIITTKLEWILSTRVEFHTKGYEISKYPLEMLNKEIQKVPKSLWKIVINESKIVVGRVELEMVNFVSWRAGLKKTAFLDIRKPTFVLDEYFSFVTATKIVVHKKVK